MPKKLAIFASGNGSNAENICGYFKDLSDIEVVLICSNKKDAFVLERAKKLNLNTLVFSKKELSDFVIIEKKLTEFKVNFIVLAGFLLKIPQKMIKKYPNKIINIHPALLPKYGGKGMYGSKVHKTVLENKEKESGITIHYVNSKYDEGEIIFQANCDIVKEDTLESLANKIHKLEFQHFPKIIELIITSSEK
ncbi:MAG: phosphoribosylglycinamide formyltransferase [Flavobacteriales bacterium]|nr:phosphoribosylglycinamide formyltransferase [Flavobacteriales bacterium]